MAEVTVKFQDRAEVQVAAGTLLVDAAIQAGVAIDQPCGSQGRCGRCAVRLTAGAARRRSTMRLSPEDVAAGYVLACQTVVTEAVTVAVPAPDSLERRLTTDRPAAAVSVPVGYDPGQEQSLRRVTVTLDPPSLTDQRDDWSRLTTVLKLATGTGTIESDLATLRALGSTLRDGDWRVTAWLLLSSAKGAGEQNGRLIALAPGAVDEPLLGVAIDIGTTTVTVWLVDLESGQAVAQAAEYNRQIRRGEDVISRVIYAGKPGGQEELRALVLKSVNTLIERVCLKARSIETGLYANCRPASVMKATVVGNSIMVHLLLGISPANIRLMPFVTGVNSLPVLAALDVGFAIHERAPVVCLPGVASYVGSDITAGVLASGLERAAPISLFLDIGTNGELVLGGRDWLVTCACSAGPAFEGAGVQDGMRATAGAVEEIWLDGETLEPSFRVIGGGKPRGLCGSGLIALLAEMFLTGVIDKAGHINQTLPSERIRRGAHGPEYVVAWADETEHGVDVVITHVDIDNLLRAKAAIYAGITVLAESVGLALTDIEQVLIGGAFGQYINIEKGIQIGLLPDLNGGWRHFHFLGNTAIRGAYLVLLSQEAETSVADIAARMTYVELSADNAFYDAFTSALFLPHTELDLFPSVAAEQKRLGAPMVGEGAR